MSAEAKLWQEVSQHLDLGVSMRRLAGIIAEHLPVDALILRRFEREPHRLVTVGVEFRGRTTHGHPWPTRTELDSAHERILTRFLAQDQLARASEIEPTLLASLVPAGLEGQVIIGPLSVGKKATGVALLVTGTRVKISQRDLEKIEHILPPLSIALENDQRLHELTRMRESIEADRDAGISQRQEISDVVIGETGGLRAVMKRVEQVAPTDAPVLIFGETGSGKEVIARAIHARSRRSKGPVVRVNCGAIPTELVDSELFGHERGSFTGATATRKGWFERADGGTLFLDEVGELPLAAQVRLLRVLQDGSLERVGGHQSITVDVRIVAATHRNVEAMVQSGLFREDLWYRLSVFPVRLPPLRERIEDIAALATYFAERAGQRVGVTQLAPTAADLELLRRYSWPGNVRELAAVLERAAILGNGKRLELASALGNIPAPPGPSAQTTGDPAREVNRQPGDIAPLDVAMADHIKLALAACHGRIEGPFGVAKVLGLNPHTLRARMRKLKIEWSSFRG